MNSIIIERVCNILFGGEIVEIVMIKVELILSVAVRCNLRLAFVLSQQAYSDGPPSAFRWWG